MIKITWGLIGINTIALLVFIAVNFILNDGKHVDYRETGGIFILAGLGLVVMLLATVPLRYSHSTGTIVFSGISAAIPLVIFVGIFTNNKVPALKKDKTFTEIYYEGKIPRSIAAAIEDNDTTTLKQLIKGQDFNLKGTRVWDAEGLNYLQFAIRLRSNPNRFPFNDEANIAAIKILIANGAATTPALSETVKYLTPDQVLLLLNTGSDSEVRGSIDLSPLLFQVINDDKRPYNITVLLLQNGADINAIKDSIYTPVMYAAYRAGTTENCEDTWRLVRFLLEEAHADYVYTAKNGISLRTIINNLQQEAMEKNITMPPDFNTVVAWLQERKITPEPSTNTNQQYEIRNR